MTGSQVPPTMPQLTPAEALALLLETGCEQFETLQRLASQELQLISIQQNDIRRDFRLQRAHGCIAMSLGKSFVANVIRARRICEHGSPYIKVDRIERKLFLSATARVLAVRDVNEHGFDVDNNKSPPALHFNKGGLLDETSLAMNGPDDILMGPINLCGIYLSTARMRNLAGYASQASKSSAR